MSREVPERGSVGFGGNARRGITFTSLGQAARLGLQLAGIALLARLLQPGDFGLVAMVVALVGIAEVMRDFGLTFGSIQSRTMSRQLQSNLFWVNVLAGLTLTLLVVGAAGPIAAFYSDDRLVGLTFAIAPLFFLNGLGAQHRADLNRRMRFGWLAGIEVASVSVGLSVALIVAYFNGGYWALVLQFLATSATASLCFVFAAHWLPTRFKRGHGTTAVVRFGRDLVASQLLTYAGERAAAVIIGVRLGPSPLGFFDRAQRLVSAPITQIRAPATKVALPILAPMQDQPERFAATLLRAQALLIHPTMAGLLVVAATAPALVPMALGAGWTQAVLPFQVLCLAASAQMASYPSYWAYLAKGAMKRDLKYSLATRPLMVVLTYLGSYAGIAGAAGGLAAGALVHWIVGSWWLRKVIGHRSARAVFCASARAYATYGGGILVLLVLQGVGGRSALASALALGTCFGSILCWPRLRSDLLVTLKYAGRLLAVRQDRGGPR